MPPREARLSAAKRLYGRRWQRARKLFLLQPEHGFCVDCKAEGHDSFATVVDHVIPHRGDERLFWDQRNWEPRCERHHNMKTGRGL